MMFFRASRRVVALLPLKSYIRVRILAVAWYYLIGAQEIDVQFRTRTLCAVTLTECDSRKALATTGLDKTVKTLGTTTTFDSRLLER